MSTASILLFTRSLGKAQRLHEITFNQTSIFAAVPLFGFATMVTINALH